MLTVHCPKCDRSLALTAQTTEVVESRQGRQLIRWWCWCGHRGALISRPMAEAA